MKFIGLKFTTTNIGDEIQAIAAEQFIGKVEKRFDRDKLKGIDSDEKYVLILNGWFSHSPDTSLPTPDNVLVIITGLHIDEGAKEHFSREEIIAFFKKNEPIGCRDRGTLRFLQNLGVKAFFSGCLSLTFPLRTTSIKKKKVFLVDIPHYFESCFPRVILENSEKLTHFHNDYGEFNFLIAQKLLDKYRKEASLIITTRIHCALPCIAMGIPVIYFGNPESNRENLLSDIGLKIYPLYRNINPKISQFFSKLKLFFLIDLYLKRKNKKVLKIVDWEGECPDISYYRNSLKNYVISKLSEIRSK